MGIIKSQSRLLRVGGGGLLWGGGGGKPRPFSFSLLDFVDLSLREQLELREI